MFNLNDEQNIVLISDNTTPMFSFVAAQTVGHRPADGKIQPIEELAAVEERTAEVNILFFFFKKMYFDEGKLVVLINLLMCLII
jgi:hypothetical protein